MPIQPTDIKLLESERMRDTSDGGGRMTGRVIPSGEAGNVFPKVSRVDSVYGRVNLRKIYLAVRTATLDMYAGAHAIITDPPDNDRISCVLFATGSAFDTRLQARDRIESYVVAGPFSRLRLYGNQLVGQKAILVYQREEEPLPDVGEVFALSLEASGFAAAQQFIRVSDVTHEVRTFTDNLGDYRRRVITLKLNSSLVQTFPGAEVTRLSSDPGATRIRSTQVADASKYYGIQPLVEEIPAGALSARLASVYAPLVPSTQRETAVSLAQIAGAQRLTPAGGVMTVAHTYPGITVSSEYGPTLRLDRAVMPGTLRIVIGIYVWEDNGLGELSLGGTIDYASGVISLRHSTSAITFFSSSVEFVPAVQISQPSHTRDIPVTLSTRGTVYSETLLPLPAPGSLIVDYRALGRWYRLRDDGAGQLVANDPSEGTGSVDYVTGALILTLGAAPDVDSAVLMAWGSPAHFAIRAGATTDAGSTLRLAYDLDHAPVVPGTVTIRYPVGGVSRDVTDSGADGNLAGAGATGTIDYATGRVMIDFSAPPDRAANVSSAYTWRDGVGLYSGTTATISGGQFTVPGVAPFRNGGTMEFTVIAPSGANLKASGYITPGGQVRVRAYGDRSGNKQTVHAWIDQAVGTFDSITGIVTLTNAVAGNVNTWGGLVSADYAWNVVNTTFTVTSVADIRVERDTEAYDPQAVTGETIAVSAVGLSLDLTQTVGDSIVPGSVRLRATGKVYVDRSGTLYADVDPLTGSGFPAGSIDYSSGVATLTLWADSQPVNCAVDACLTQYGDWTAVDVFFRTAGSPIRQASLYVQVTAANGDLLTGTAGPDGVITGPHMRGAVEQSMGIVAVEFGEQVGPDWVPREVMPGTLRYNCVVITNLPLEASVLGLDPVRLPADGRVPIYRPGDVVVIHNTAETALNNPVSAGATYSVGRTGLAVLRVEDAAGAELAADRYVTDLAAGTVTIAADWDGTGIAQPLVAVHRIEDMGLLADVQINGEITLSAPTVHAYPTEGTYVSSALLYGDLQAIVTTVFDQQTWTGEWSDTVIGSQANAQYDDINNPIEVINESAVTERWRIQFTSSTAFQIIGENLGVIGTGSTGEDLAPINPVIEEPYFVIRAAGWGGGWSAGNQLRFNTIGANGPTWIARTILAGAALDGDSFDLEARGDVD